jgi:plasmid stability protein
VRTTVDLDTDLLERLRVEAARRRISFKDLLNSVIRSGLASGGGRRPATYTMPSFSMGAVREGIDLDKALRVADELEATEVRMELDRRK